MQLRWVSNPADNRNCTEWRQNNLDDITVKSTLHTVNTYPWKPNGGPCHSPTMIPKSFRSHIFNPISIKLYGKYGKRTKTGYYLFGFLWWRFEMFANTGPYPAGNLYSSYTFHLISVKILLWRHWLLAAMVEHSLVLFLAIGQLLKFEVLWNLNNHGSQWANVKMCTIFESANCRAKRMKISKTFHVWSFQYTLESFGAFFKLSGGIAKIFKRQPESMVIKGEYGVLLFGDMANFKTLRNFDHKPPQLRCTLPLATSLSSSWYYLAKESVKAPGRLVFIDDFKPANPSNVMHIL